MSATMPTPRTPIATLSAPATATIGAAAALLREPARPLRLLVSVRSPAEALLAAAAGVELIDLKEPSDGALGALPPPRLRAVVAALRRQRLPQGLLLSATTGDLPSSDVATIVERVRAVAAAGVDFVKVGIDGGPASRLLLRRLADEEAAIVPVLIADAGVDGALVDLALTLGRFPALMLDTNDKRAGSLLQRLPSAALAAFVGGVQSAGMAAGLAGSLRRDDLPALCALRPDYAGFRGAVCDGDRTGTLSAALLSSLRRRRDALVPPGNPVTERPPGTLEADRDGPSSPPSSHPTAAVGSHPR